MSLVNRKTIGLRNTKLLDGLFNGLIGTRRAIGVRNIKWLDGLAHGLGDMLGDRIALEALCSRDISVLLGVLAIIHLVFVSF